MSNPQLTQHDSLTNTLAAFGIALDNLEASHIPMTTGHLVADSRQVQSGDVFVATMGHDLDGRDYIKAALEVGAHAVISETTNVQAHGQYELVNGALIVEFYQLSYHLFSLCQHYYQCPQEQLNLIGITGTNGKTSVSLLTAKLLDFCHSPCAVIGTVGAGTAQKLQPIDNTTPGPTQLHHLFTQFIEQKLANVAMEVSSHALEQRRVNAELFDVAVFTNLSRDHLDYHKTMANYAEAKFKVFSGKENQMAIVNGDDEQAKLWLSAWNTKQSVIVYGCEINKGDYAQYLLASNVVHHKKGVDFLLESHLGNVDISSQLMGDFNISNLLAAIAVLMHQGFSLEKIKVAVNNLSPIIGRMESFSRPEKATAVVDYAHTPDALTNALKACRQHCQGELWLVFGCGGDRDKGKRELMGQAAEADADHIIVTNDNPRTEQPMAIANDILAGCQQPNKITVLLERQSAVIHALKQAKADDMILLAGKGHEDYIILGNEKIPYNERQLVQTYYQGEVLS